MDPESTPEDKFFDFFKATKLQLITFTATGIFFMGICWIPIVLRVLRIDLSTIEDVQASNNLFLGNFDFTSYGSAFLWFLLGCVVYLLLWGMIVFVVDSYNNVVISSAFVHPKSFHRSTYWAAIMGRFLIRVAASVILLTLAIFTYAKLVPLWSYRVTFFHAEGGIPTNIFRLVVVLVSWVVVLHMFTLLLRLIFLRRRVLG